MILGGHQGFPAWKWQGQIVLLYLISNISSVLRVIYLVTWQHSIVLPIKHFATRQNLLDSVTLCHFSPYAIILRSITAVTFLLDFRECIKLVIQIVIKHCYLDMTFLKKSRHVKGRVKKKNGWGITKWDESWRDNSWSHTEFLSVWKPGYPHWSYL